MSVEVVRRLLESGMAARADIEVALLESVIRGVPFVQAFSARRAELKAVLERELARVALPTVPTIRTVHANAGLCARLPVGMCERLMAVPIRQESITKTVDVASVDPFDAHVKQEFSFHLDAPVRILKAPMGEVLAALDGLYTGGAFVSSVHEMLGVAQEPTQDFDTRVLAAEPSGDTGEPTRKASSQPPIPLVRKPSHAARAGTSGVIAPASRKATPRLESDERGQPVIDLRRAKPATPDAVTRSRLREADLVQVERQLAAARSPAEVVELMAEHACPEGSTLIFTAKSNEWVAKAASFEVTGLDDVSIVKSRASVFQAAVESGHYLGKLPETLAHALMRDLLAERLGPEVYLVPAFVAGRPSLILLVTGFERSFHATRRADRIAGAAGQTLERLLLEKKRTR